MKKIFFILLFFVSTSAFAQDSCSLSFISSSGAISDLHKAKIKKFKEGRIVNSVNIKASVLEGEAVAKNRFITEQRVESVRQSLLSFGVPLANISKEVYLTKDATNWNSINVFFDFAPLKGDKVLKSTPIVQISEVNYVAPRKEVPPKVVEKNIEEKEQAEALEVVKKNELLSVEDFKKNETINLPNLLFEGGTHFILPGSESVLNELVAVMKAKPKLKIELQGHICCKMGGMDGYDATTGMENLSVMRAKVVYLYIMSKGVDQDRMSFKGFGSSRKIYPDDLFNTANAMQNRRVEVLVLSVD